MLPGHGSEEDECRPERNQLDVVGQVHLQRLHHAARREQQHHAHGAFLPGVQDLIRNQEKQDAGQEQGDQEPEIRQEHVVRTKLMVFPAEPALDHAVPDASAEKIPQAPDRFHKGFRFRDQQANCSDSPERQAVRQERNHGRFCPRGDTLPQRAFAGPVKIPGGDEEEDEHDFHEVVQHLSERARSNQVIGHHDQDRQALQRVHSKQAFLFSRHYYLLLMNTVDEQAFLFIAIQNIPQAPEGVNQSRRSGQGQLI